MTSRTFLFFLLAGVVALATNPARAEKPDRLLESLIARCQKMHDLQAALLDGTKALQKVIDGNPGKKLRPEDRRAALRLAEMARGVVAEGNAILNMLKKEDSAVAFCEVLEELIADARRVQYRLEKVQVGAVTQTLAQDVLDTLDEMLHAVR
jgi:hypothetical protein